MTSSLKVHRLTKRYGKKLALNDLSFELMPGSFNVLLGPNGAGKSTLFQLLTGLFSPDEGQVMVAGHPLSTQARQAMRHIGIVFQQASLDLDLSVGRSLRMHADMHGIPSNVAKARLDEVLAALGLTQDVQRPARELSGGNRRKVELARALLHQPSVLLMDEATVGLDPKSRRDLLSALHHDVSQRGSCVLWATHWVEEAAQAQRVLILHHGRLLADGTPAEVTKALGATGLEEGFVQATQSNKPLETA